MKTREVSQVLRLRLDSSELPFTLNTTQDLFIAHGDLLDIACIARPGHLEIYGIRNNEDGTVCLAHTRYAKGTLLCLVWIVGFLTIFAALLFGGQTSGHFSNDDWMLLYIGLGISVSMLIAEIVAHRFGHTCMPPVMGHTQPGGWRERRAARKALALTQASDSH